MKQPPITAHQLARLLLTGPDLPVVVDGDIDGSYPVAYPTVRWWKPGIVKAHQRTTHRTRAEARKQNIYEDDRAKPVEKIIAL